MVMTYNGWGDMPEDQREAMDVFDHTDAARSPMLDAPPQHIDLKAALDAVMETHGANLQRLEDAVWPRQWVTREEMEATYPTKHNPFDDHFTPEVSDF